MTSLGLVPIEEVQARDMVLARDEITGEVAYREVKQTFVTLGQELVEISVEDDEGNKDSFKATPGHEIWTKDKGWTEAKDLLPGDEMFTSLGGWVRVTSNTWVSGSQTVYNFEVDGFHTYFVGESGVWVHNSCTAEVGASKSLGRTGKQAKLRELANDPKVSSADRGWIKNEIRHVKTGNRKTIRVPGNSRNSKQGGKVLAHERGKRAKNGFGYEHSNLQDTDLHKLEHKYEGY